MPVNNIQFPAAFEGLFQPSRYKCYWGGRGGAKSWALARALLLKAVAGQLRILCARELQTSIADSVHRLLSDQIQAMNLDPYFEVARNSIKSVTGSEFLFKGIRHSVQEIKSLEGVDICWVEEAQSVSAASWEILIPTIRKQSSEIWISFNPVEESDPTYQRFVLHPPPDAIVRKVGWEDNPWFPATLDAERRYMLELDLEAYEHIWGGHCRKISEAVIFAKRVSIEAFDTPDGARFFHGADWGFANDPTALVRCFIQDDCLYIDQEAFGYGVEIDETPQLFDSIPTARYWPIKADSSRPETISYMRRRGFNIMPAEKWEGSVEDGIAHLKGFRRIVIHQRCKHLQEERRLYSYKVDPKTREVLPIIVDKHNHGWDAIRYSLDGYIQRRGGMGVWAQLAS
ncbi:MAG TPA: PBSX family phage terminase large subunit [Bryobacteraceae bacterium]|nr:PBSX family phage terminase large subunit [Bryobacteraceae bacterium]